MKVLHIYNALMPSGAEKMWCDAMPLLASVGVKIHVLATAQVVGSYRGRFESCGCTVHHLYGGEGRCGWNYCIKLFKLIRAERFDAVQIHPERRRFTNFLVAKMAGVGRVSTTVHSVFAFGGIRKLKRMVLLKTMHAMGAKIVAISDSVRSNERTYGYNPMLIYNWIDTQRFTMRHDVAWRKSERVKLGVGDADKVIIVVGNCADVKNHCFFMRMFAQLPLNFVALHVGGESEVTLEERCVAKEYGIAERVRFLGARDDLPDLLDVSDVFVMCSKYEGLGNACIEALAMGVPSVVSDVVGLRDLARVSRRCRTVTLDERLFADAVNEASRMDRCDCERALIEEKFGMNANVRAYLSLWGMPCGSEKGVDSTTSRGERSC